MWSGPWQGWGDVPKEDRDRLFERFQCYFQWEKKWNAKIHSCWEKCIAGKFVDMLSRARNGAIAMATKRGLKVGDDTSVLHDFKPALMRIEPWKELCEIWNTPEWKEKRRRNKENRNKSTGGKHTLGSQTFVTAKLEAAKKLGREPEFFEMWRQSRCKKGRRPLDKAQECTSNVSRAWILKKMVKNKIKA
ncbi:putative transposase, Ptta/En/Spm, plant [Helianthus annuus]|nr:putative transposase, Ptta/En/Spm, plant [Helianthus annuus]